MVRVTVRLPESLAAQLKTAGNGNISEGVRTMMSNHETFTGYPHGIFHRLDLHRTESGNLLYEYRVQGQSPAIGTWKSTEEALLDILLSPDHVRIDGNKLVEA
jgi:hypothetical protein